MKILVLAPHPFYQERGTPIDLDLVLRTLSGYRHEVDLLTYHEGQERTYPNVTHHRIRAPHWLKDIRPGFSFRKMLCDLLLFIHAWHLLRSKSYDVVHAGEEAIFFAMFFKRIYGVPFLYDMDSSLAQQLVEKMRYLRLFSRIFARLEESAIRRSLAVAPVCPALADLAKSRGARAVVPLYDISQLSQKDFKPQRALRQRLGADAVLGIYVGNLEVYQGVDLLLESLPLARQSGANVEIVVAGGHANDIEKYRRKAISLGVSNYVHFIGPWPIDQLGRLLASADFLIAPRTKGINTPMKIYPYLHSGRPVLATQLPTHTQILDDSVAMLAPANPEAFGSAMARLAADKDLRVRLGMAGRRLVEQRHTYTHYQSQMQVLYEIAAKAV